MTRNRRRTIESLKRLAERPGTPAEGETARRLLEKMGENISPPYIGRVFTIANFPRGTRVFYQYWAYENATGAIACDLSKVIQGQIWMRIKFDHLKQARWVPVTSKRGCHLAQKPFHGDEAILLENLWVDSVEEFNEWRENILRMATA
jgi:hypothetical protein